MRQGPSTPALSCDCTFPQDCRGASAMLSRKVSTISPIAVNAAARTHVAETGFCCSMLSRGGVQRWRGVAGTTGSTVAGPVEANSRQQAWHPAATVAAGRRLAGSTLTAHCLLRATQTHPGSLFTLTGRLPHYVAVLRLFRCARARLTFSASAGSTKMRCSSQCSPTLVSFFATPCSAHWRGDVRAQPHATNPPSAGRGLLLACVPCRQA